jgi:alkylation response protein AidB-like acyl-CoA dehydrogenase
MSPSTIELWPPLAVPEFTQAVRQFATEHIAPVADEMDAQDLYPRELVKELASRGFSAITLPTEYGGGGQDFASAVVLFEEVAVASAAVGVSLLTIFQAQTIIRLFGSDSLKQRYLPRFAAGMLASYALTEASHGSDIRTLDTKARREGDSWVIRGEKHFITSAMGAEFFVILAETERETPQLSLYEGRNSATFGLRNGPHLNLLLEDVRVPLDHLIGTEGKGVRQAVTTLDYSRTLAAAISIGIARAAFDGAYAHVAQRQAFGQAVLGFQGIQWYLADALSEIDAARLLVFHAARALDTHVAIDRYGSEAKLRASEVATRAASMAVQVCGAHGAMINSPFGRYLRDAKTYEIAGGSSEILKNTIGKYLQRGAAGPAR